MKIEGTNSKRLGTTGALMALLSDKEKAGIVIFRYALLSGRWICAVKR